MKFSFLAVSFLFALAAHSSEGFRKVNRQDVPRAAVSVICPDDDDGCWRDFAETGEAYELDVDSAGNRALLVFGGVGWGGSGGDSYCLLQEQAKRWKEIGRDCWQLYHGLHLKRLGRVRDGHYDFRLGKTLCIKWQGNRYVAYAPGDYRNLPISAFNETDPEDAEIFWLIRYAGARDAVFEPRWMPKPLDLHEWSPREEKDTPALKDDVEQVTWMSSYRGSVWGVKGDQAFVLLPRATYLGAEEITVQGDWLSIQGHSGKCRADNVELARYNLRTHRLKINRCAQIPFEAN